MGKRITEDQWRHYYNLRKRGYAMARAAREAGIGRTTAWAHEKDRPHRGEDIKRKREESKVPDPIPLEELEGPAKRAVEDFGFFREYYLGRETKPWQEDAAYKVVEFLASPEEDYVVINVPPGSGKSTTFTHDIPAWLIMRNRAIRCMIGSRTAKQAQAYTMRLKRTFERPTPAEGAKGVMSLDFGRFKPEERDLWRGDEFIVEQFGGVLIGEKEPTVKAAAQETGFLGGRFDFVIWDDLVDNKNTRTEEAREALREWYALEAETRLEPGGVFILQGQRIGPEDLYRHALDMRAGGVDDEDEDEDGDGEVADRPRKYKHIIYPAHFDDDCKGLHSRTDPAWPEGCLLDPKRLSWKRLQTAKENDPRRYRITYQQEDVDPSDQLIPEIYLTGGEQNGVVYPGCYDRDRGPNEIPEGLVGPVLSVISADPSPTKWWSVQWWLYDAASEQRFLIDHVRRPMDANQFLDFIPRVGYTGLLHDWVNRARDLGAPIQYVIVERNAAQRFMLQYQFVHDWTVKQGVLLVPHDTHSNKTDPEFGVQMIASAYRHGRVRLPYKWPYGRDVTKPLADELQKWPDGATEDCVMANWFFEYQLPNLKFQLASRPRAHRPSWVLASV